MYLWCMFLDPHITTHHADVMYVIKTSNRIRPTYLIRSIHISSILSSLEKNNPSCKTLERKGQQKPYALILFFYNMSTKQLKHVGYADTKMMPWRRYFSLNITTSSRIRYSIHHLFTLGPTAH